MKATQPRKPTAQEPRKAGRAGDAAQCPGGSENTWQGFGKTIQGFCETIQGFCETIQGFRKTKQGSGKAIQGFRETKLGSGKTIQGFRGTMQGFGKTIQGFRRTLQGFENTMLPFQKTRRLFRGFWLGFMASGRGFGRPFQGGWNGGLDAATELLGSGDSLQEGAFSCRPSEAQAFRFWDGLRWSLFGCLFFGRTPSLTQREGIPH
jgi:predicted small secreted protein